MWILWFFNFCFAVTLASHIHAVSSESRSSHDVPLAEQRQYSRYVYGKPNNGYGMQQTGSSNQQLQNTYMSTGNNRPAANSYYVPYPVTAMPTPLSSNSYYSNYTPYPVTATPIILPSGQCRATLTSGIRIGICVVVETTPNCIEIAISQDCRADSFCCLTLASPAPATPAPATPAPATPAPATPAPATPAPATPAPATPAPATPTPATPAPATPAPATPAPATPAPATPAPATPAPATLAPATLAPATPAPATPAPATPAPATPAPATPAPATLAPATLAPATPAPATPAPATPAPATLAPATPAPATPAPATPAPATPAPATPAPATPTPTTPESRLTHAQALARLTGSGIRVSSSGDCSDPEKSTCTSLEKILSRAIDEIIAFQQQSHTDVIVTGGTEAGHALGEKSHATGFKLDIQVNSGVTNYIEKTFKDIGSTDAGWKQYRDEGGNIWTHETDPEHWDLLIA